MYVCPICHALIDDRARHLDWHAARTAAPIRRRRYQLDPITAETTTTRTVTWATPMPDDAYTVATAIDADLIGVMDLHVAAITATGCQVEITPHYDLTDAVLDLTAHYPVEATPDGR